MGNRTKSTYEKGKFKEEIHAALYKSKDIKELLLGDISKMSTSKIREEFKNHVFSHLFIDDTIEEADTFIFYDVVFPSLKTNIKNCKVIMYVICHRSILDDYYKDGYYGNRADILSQMVEDVLINDKEVANSFGIGELNLDSIEIYNSQRFYGNSLIFDVPSFR